MKQEFMDRIIRMELGVRIRQIFMTIFYISFIFVLTACKNKNAYDEVESDFISKRSAFFWEDGINKELSLYQYDEYYIYHYSYVESSSSEAFERISVWVFDRNLGGRDFYKEKAHIYLLPYDLSDNYPEEYQLYLNAKETGLIKEYSSEEIQEIAEILYKHY